MNLKSWKVLSVFLIFILSSLFHFIYDWFPNTITSLIFPVNESIWEHNKIIILSFLVLALIEKLYYKNKKNTLWAGLVSGGLCTILVMLIFTPIYLYILKMQDNIIITFVIYIIAISISEYVSYRLLLQNYKPRLEKFALIIWPLIFILNGILTYYPFKTVLFYDYTKNIYGIS